MFRVALAQAMRRRARGLAVVLAIVMASVSFALLTSAVATSRLDVQGTVEENYRTAYDILVRPAGTASDLEESEGLVQQNYLSGIYGGITMDQLRQIRSLPEVEVAAPVAMIGYILATVDVQVRINEVLTDDRDQLYRFTPTWTTDRGLSQLRDQTSYEYFTRRPLHWDTPNDTVPPQMRRPSTGGRVQVCEEWRQQDERLPQRDAFDYSRMSRLGCDGSNPPRPGRGADQLELGQIGFNFPYQFPMLMAAIDPVQEARLVGLDDAVVSGRYLTARDRTVIPEVTGKRFTKAQVPILMVNRPLTNDRVELRVERLDVPPAAELVDRLSGPRPADWVARLPGRPVKTVRVTGRQAYDRLLRAYAADAAQYSPDYWTLGTAAYERAGSGALRVVDQPPSRRAVFRNFYQGGYQAPAPSGDVNFRRLAKPLQTSSQIVNGMLGTPYLQQVGVFDPDLIEGFSELSEVPLTTYYPPDTEPADARSRELLKGRSLLPNANLGGYLQQPPMILTTIKSLETFKDPTYYPFVKPEDTEAPVSVIRIRVAGVTGADDESQTRVRLVAERIARETGLTVDITIGSSPTPQTIVLPAGDFGRPDLALTEGWVVKGVSVRLLSSIDKKSLTLFGLVLVVCVLFMGNATLAAVRTRRAELGVLACLGWSARRIFIMLQVELLLTGLIAGALGTALASAVVGLSGLDVTWWHLALITPVATLLAALSGVIPAWRASHATPIQAIRPDVRGPKRAATGVRGITTLALVGLRRLPGRTLLGATSLFIGVCALSVLLAVQQAFQGGVTGTALGDVIAVQVRGVDYLAAAVTIALGAFAIADITYLNISERTAEIGTLRSTGWTENHVRRLFAVESLATATLGAVAGAVVGVTAAALLLPIPLTTSLTAAAIATAGGIVAAMVAATAPLSRLTQLAPATAIVTE